MESEKNYYLYGTTDKNVWKGKAIGFDVYKSKNLEEWEGPFIAFLQDIDFWADENFWAPEVYFYNKQYYMLASFKTKGKSRGIQILVADNPLGQFKPLTKDPLTPSEWECLDGTLYFQEGEPWLIFSHEWTQIGDGEICCVRLSKDLKERVGAVQVLWKASSAPWTASNVGSFLRENQAYVTDGPFVVGKKENTLEMIWSSFTKTAYAIGIAYSESGNIQGPWKHREIPLFDKDGGHGMVFATFEGKRLLTIHTPNETSLERAIFSELQYGI